MTVSRSSGCRFELAAPRGNRRRCPAALAIVSSAHGGSERRVGGRPLPSLPQGSHGKATGTFSQQVKRESRARRARCGGAPRVREEAALLAWRSFSRCVEAGEKMCEGCGLKRYNRPAGRVCVCVCVCMCVSKAGIGLGEAAGASEWSPRVAGCSRLLYPPPPQTGCRRGHGGRICSPLRRSPSRPGRSRR